MKLSQFLNQLRIPRLFYELSRLLVIIAHDFNARVQIEYVAANRAPDAIHDSRPICRVYTAVFEMGHQGTFFPNPEVFLVHRFAAAIATDNICQEKIAGFSQIELFYHRRIPWPNWYSVPGIGDVYLNNGDEVQEAA